MDWSKAKNIMIFIFLALNIFLLVNIIILNKGEDISAETRSNTKKILSDRGIKLNCEIPALNGNIGRLNYEESELDTSGIAGKLLGKDNTSERIEYGKELISGSKRLVFLDANTFIYTNSSPQENVDISSNSEIEKSIRKFLTGIDIPVTEYHIDLLKIRTESAVTLILSQRYKDLIVFDNYINATVTKQGIINLECKYKKIKNSSSEAMRIMPAHQVLLKNFYEGKEAVINRIDIGYKGYNQEQGIRTFSESPTWRIIKV